MSHSPKGYSCYCFRCHTKGFVPHKGLSISELRDMRAAMQEYREDSSLELPKDFTLAIPDKALVWLLKSGITAELRSQYGIGYSETMHRVVVPVYDNGDLVATVSRAIDFPKQQPKYLEKSKKGVMFTSNSIDKPLLGDDTVVLTEDVLSAMRVGTVNRAVASLGTSMSDAEVSKLLSKYNRVLVWYDNDEAGIKGAKKISKQIRLQGGLVYIIKADEDPKYYNSRQIQEVLNDK